MTIYEFNLLPDIEKEEAVQDRGIFISTYSYDDKMFDNYQLDSFYVQFYYSVEGDDETSVLCFTNADNILSEQV